jgi:2-oxoisovalerate dehydrogenase E1 component
MKSSTLSNTRAFTLRPPAPNASLRSRSVDQLTRDDLVWMYRTMLLSRRIDDKEIQLKNQSLLFFQISGAGHEAILVAAGLALRAGYDWFYPYYRDRALCLALGMTPREMFLAGVGSSEDPTSGGRQMPSHWGDRRLHIVSQSSATGTQCVQAVGCAEAAVLYDQLPDIPDRAAAYRSDEVTYVSVGDGATSEGEFWESLNTATLHKLPVLFVVEDNGYAISVPVAAQTPGGSISRLVESFPNLKVLRCDGTDILASYRAMLEAAAWCRERRGPALVHATVIRPYSHSHSDDERGYKTAAERAEEMGRDPIVGFAALLKRREILTDADLAEIAADVDREVNEAAESAVRAPRPSRETAAHYVYSPDVDPAGAAFEAVPEPDGPLDTMVAAINRTLKDEMAVNPRIVVFGEDVADATREENLKEVPGKGGVFNVTLGLQRTYGGTRVFNSQLAEAAIVGRACGMGLRGLKPVPEIQFFDYIWPAMMQLRDEISMLRYRSNNMFACPMVVRVAIGGYLRGGSVYHSQSGESIFAHCPGLRVVYPSTAQDAAGLLRTALRSEDPVLFLEHKHLYRQTYNKGVYPGANYTIPFARAAVRREGTDVAIVTWGALVQRSLVAAQQAEAEGVSTMVVDLRTIAPCDWDGIAAAVRRTNRVVVAHEDQLTCGFGAEIAARIASDLFDELDAPVRRVAALDTPVAYHPDLEDAILPGSADVLNAILETAKY